MTVDPTCHWCRVTTANLRAATGNPGAVGACVKHATKPSNPKWRCPDGGHCHHECQTACYRVLACGPLSGEFPDDKWPEDVVRAHQRI